MLTEIIQEIIAEPIAFTLNIFTMIYLLYL